MGEDVRSYNDGSNSLTKARRGMVVTETPRLAVFVAGNLAPSKGRHAELLVSFGLMKPPSKRDGDHELATREKQQQREQPL